MIKNILKKYIVTSLIVTIFLIANINVEASDMTAPAISISGASVGAVNEGGSVSYVVSTSDDVGVTGFSIRQEDITLVGFSANISISKDSAFVRTITFSNIKNVGSTESKYFVLSSGVSKDAFGNYSNSKNSSAFTIKTYQNDNTGDNTTPVITITKLTTGVITEGGKVTYTIKASDNVGVTSFGLNKSHITMNGFTANVSITGTGLVRTVAFSNIKSTNTSKSKYFTVVSGVARDAASNKSSQKKSEAFSMQLKTTDNTAPVLKISVAKPKAIYNKAEVTYVIKFTDNVAVTKVDLQADDIKLHGFTANIEITGSGLTKTIILKNVEGTIGVNKYITIGKGVALDKVGNMSKATNSPKFSILSKEKVETEEETVEPTIITTKCIDNLGILGSINKENSALVAELKSEKQGITYVQENNYVAEGTEITYFVDYYNGSTKDVKNVNFELNIPYKVEVSEISSSGATTCIENSTVINWNIDEIKAQAYCRLEVKVKYMENVTLKTSQNISEEYYVTLKNTCEGTENYSYLRQIFVDNTEGKTGTYKNYLTAIDKTNTVRPEDEITRAEFAKMLADSGIITVKENSDAYKTFKDYEEIPVYARDAVSALAETNILQTFSDGEFKPSNPILVEDAIEMIAKASMQISNGKLNVNTPVFLNEKAIMDDENVISPKSGYIMELIRQNIIDKNKVDVDKYILRRETIELINALTFRGPYTEKLPESTVKFSDVKEGSLYFYNIIGASNSYTYTYNHKLWQEIVSVY